MRGLDRPGQAFAEGHEASVLERAADSYRDHVEGQLKLFGNRKREADLAAGEMRDGETVTEELQLT